MKDKEGMEKNFVFLVFHIYKFYKINIKNLIQKYTIKISLKLIVFRHK